MFAQETVSSMYDSRSCKNGKNKTSEETDTQITIIPIVTNNNESLKIELKS